MFAYLQGILDRKLTDSLVLDVNGVGYRVFTSSSTLFGSAQTGSEVKVYTHLYVREDNVSLYGFISEEELKMFEQLLSVSGVGPKAAISLVSTLPPAQFGLAVLTEDADRFTKAPGIGKKTALRIILELKDKLKKEQADFHDLKGPVAAAMAQGRGSSVQEAVSALIMLGYSSQEANRAVAACAGEGKTVEDLIRDALKAMV